MNEESMSRNPAIGEGVASVPTHSAPLLGLNIL